MEGYSFRETFQIGGDTRHAPVDPAARDRMVINDSDDHRTRQRRDFRPGDGKGDILPPAHTPVRMTERYAPIRSERRTSYLQHRNRPFQRSGRQRRTSLRMSFMSTRPFRKYFTPCISSSRISLWERSRPEMIKIGIFFVEAFAFRSLM